MNLASAGNSNNYQVDWISTKKVKKQKQPVQVFHPLPITVNYDAATDTAELILKGSQAFAKGGRITLISTPPGGLESASGVFLDGNNSGTPGTSGVLNILPKGRTVVPE
jgi:hypothetical protein